MPNQMGDGLHTDTETFTIIHIDITMQDLQNGLLIDLNETQSVILFFNIVENYGDENF